jgi:hypothetical protein
MQDPKILLKGSPRSCNKIGLNPEIVKEYTKDIEELITIQDT